MAGKLKKLYYVKREVVATSLEQALSAKGHVYEVALAEEKYWPEAPKQKIGLTK